MNVPGQHFALMAMDIEQSAPGVKRAKKRRRKSLIEGSREGLPAQVSPSLLKPLNRRNSMTSPPKSILRVMGTPKNRRKSLNFSPYNGVKIIPHRLEERIEDLEIQPPQRDTLLTFR